MIRQKDKLLHSDQLREEEEAAPDKSKSAERERPVLEQQEREVRQDKSRQRDGNRFSRALK
jgi:hypothetical protein